MSTEINLSTDTSIDEFAFWALETGLWDGRPITWKEAPEFFTEVERKLSQLLFSQNDFDFEKMAASLAWIGSSNHSREALAKEIEELRLSPKGEVFTVKHKHKHKKKKSFWEKHKVVIILGLVSVAVVTTVVVLTVCTGGVGGQVAATLGGAAVNGLQKALEDGSKDLEQASEDPPTTLEIPQISETQMKPSDLPLLFEQEPPQSLLPWVNESMSYLQWKEKQLQEELLSALLNKDKTSPEIEENSFPKFPFPEKIPSESLTPEEIFEAHERRYLEYKQAIESLMTGKELEISPKAQKRNYALSMTSSEYPSSPFSEAPLLGSSDQSTIHYHCGINNDLSSVVEGGSCLRGVLDEEFAVQPHLIHSNNILAGAALVGLEKLNELDINPTLAGFAGAIMSKMPKFILEHSDIQHSIDYEVETLSKIAQNIIEKGKPNLKQLHVTFSNGGYVFNEALKRLTPEQRDTIVVITTGSTAIIDANLACEVYNIIGSKDWPSLLCNGGESGIEKSKEKAEIEIIPQNETQAWIGGHYFTQPDYQKRFSEYINEEIRNKYELY